MAHQCRYDIAKRRNVVDEEVILEDDAEVRRRLLKRPHGRSMTEMQSDLRGGDRASHIAFEPTAVDPGPERGIGPLSVERGYAGPAEPEVVKLPGGRPQAIRRPVEVDEESRNVIAREHRRTSGLAMNSGFSSVLHQAALRMVPASSGRLRSSTGFNAPSARSMLIAAFVAALAS